MGVYQRHLQPRLLNLTLDTQASRAARRRVCAGLVGDVVEIGYGSGLNQPHLPVQVRRVAAVDPSAVAWQLSAARRAVSGVPVELVGDDAQHLPFPDDQLDAALSTWTLCGIPDPVLALREVRRVLKPGGVLHFVEHGLAPDAEVVRRQRRGNAVQSRIAGCVLDRDIPALLAASGFVLTTISGHYEEKAPRTTGYFYEGRAEASA